MPRAKARLLCTGMNGQWGFGGNAPKVKPAFSVSSFLLVEEAEEAEEAPTFGRGSSLINIPAGHCSFLFDLHIGIYESVG